MYSWHQGVFEQCLAARRRGHHALMIAGSPGVGAGALARRFARSILCERRTGDGSSCGRCQACAWFDAGNHPDFRALVPASSVDRDDTAADNTAARSAPDAPTAAPGRSSRAPKASKEIRIDQVRELDEFLALSAHRAAARVVLVEPADALNTIAANGLLKRLEEPPPDVVFILVTGRESLLPATIRSRCIRLRLPLPGRSEAIAWLREQTGASLDDAARWVALAGGAPLDALKLFAEGESAIFARAIDCFASLPETGIVTAADLMGDIEPVAWASVAQTWVADLVRVAAGAAPARYPDRAGQLLRLARGSTLRRLCSLEDRLRELPRQASHPLNARLLLEDVLLEYRHALA
jgi:DNA polymerase III subunit delta'